MQILLDGFTYARLGGFGGSLGSINHQKVKGLKEWLSRAPGHSYSPQPYEQLATALQSTGYKDAADEILYFGKKRAWTHGDLPRKGWMSLAYVFVGYGFRIRRALYWVVALTALGVFWLWMAADGPKNWFDRIFFALDTLLPIVTLNKSYDIKQVASPWLQGYFYFVKVMGYVLASFLIAGVTGLTKK